MKLPFVMDSTCSSRLHSPVALLQDPYEVDKQLENSRMQDYLDRKSTSCQADMTTQEKCMILGGNLAQDEIFGQYPLQELYSDTTDHFSPNIVSGMTSSPYQDLTVPARSVEHRMGQLRLPNSRCLQQDMMGYTPESLTNNVSFNAWGTHGVPEPPQLSGDDDTKSRILMEPQYQTSSFSSNPASSNAEEQPYEQPASIFPPQSYHLNIYYENRSFFQ